MQFKTFHSLCYHGIRAVIAYSTKYGNCTRNFGGFYIYFDFQYFGGVAWKSVFSLEVAGYMDESYSVYKESYRAELAIIIPYYPTLLRRVQITRETSTNITGYLYSSHSPDRAKD